MDADAYRAQLQALSPRGLAWQSDLDGVRARLLHAWGEELARVDARAAALAEESDPRTALELLAEWERAYGLPDPCRPGGSATVEGRRAMLLARILDAGGQRPADYLALAATLGISAELIECWPHSVASDVSATLCGEAWVHHWELRCDAAVQIDHWPVTGGVDEPLASWVGAPELECLLRRRKPAQTDVIVTYLAI